MRWLTVLLLMLTVFPLAAADVVFISPSSSPFHGALGLWQEAVTDIWGISSFTSLDGEHCQEEILDEVRNLDADVGIVICSGHGGDGYLSLGPGKRLEYEALLKAMAASGEKRILVVEACRSGSAADVLASGVLGKEHGDMTVLTSGGDDELCYGFNRGDSVAGALVRSLLLFGTVPRSIEVMNADAVQHPVAIWLPEGSQEAETVMLDPRTEMAVNQEKRWLI